MAIGLCQAHPRVRFPVVAPWYALTSRVAKFHATKDGFARAVGWSCKCANFALHVAAKLLL
eukprot:scaffold188518_cov18-Tisochrysis_lutea.AAC.2